MILDTLTEPQKATISYHAGAPLRIPKTRYFLLHILQYYKRNLTII